MKKLVYAIIAFAFVCFVTSCDDMNSVHQEFLDRGETVYLGIPIILEANAGHERVELVWAQNADPRIYKTIIFWNNRQDSVVVLNTGGRIVEKIVPLPEGIYMLEILNASQGGVHRSLPTEVTVESFGERFSSNLRNRVITNARVRPDYSVILTWSVEPGVVSTTITYVNRDGETITVTIAGDETTLHLLDFVPGGEFTHSSLYLPHSSSIDLVPSSPVTILFPEMPDYFDQVWTDFPRANWTITTTVADLYAPLPFGFVPDGFSGPAGEQTHTQGMPQALLNDDPMNFFSFMKLDRGAWNLANANRAPQYQHSIPNQTVLPAFIVDMGEEKTFNYFKWRHRQWNWTAIWFGARMFGSNDGVNWTQIRSDYLEAGDSDVLWIPNARETWTATNQFTLNAANNQTMRLLVDESTFRFVKMELASFSDVYGQPGWPVHPDHIGTAPRDNATVNVAIFGLGFMHWE